MLVPSAVLPMPGRPARISRSEGCRPPKRLSMSVKPGGDAGNPPAPRLGLFRIFHGAAQRFVKVHGAFAIFVGLGHRIERLFGLGDLVFGAFLGGRVIGGVDDILADADQAAAHMQIGQDVGVVADIGNGGRGGAQRIEIGLAAGLDHAGIGLHGGVQGERGHHHAAAFDHLRHGFENAAMQRIVEMLRLDQRAGALHGAVVGQDRAQQSLLDIDVVGDVAIGFLFHYAFANCFYYGRSPVRCR